MNPNPTPRPQPDDDRPRTWRTLPSGQRVEVCDETHTDCCGCLELGDACNEKRRAA